MKHSTKDQKTLFLSDNSLAARYEVHRATIWRWVSIGKFPAPVKIGGSTRWKLTDIEAWEARQAVA